jgi:hypothetical protein
MNIRQRWGTFATVDHLQRRPFVADVLLYDRLVIPSPADDWNHNQWVQRRWDPARLQRYLGVLGDLAVVVKWGQFDDDVVRQRLTPWTNPSDWSRLLLATEWLPDKPADVSEVRAVAAYPSRAACRRETHFVVHRSSAPPPEDTTRAPPSVETQQQRLAQLGYLLRYHFLVPPDESDGQTPRRDDQTPGVKQLEAAVKLARDPEFQDHRRVVHQWQEEVLARGMGDHDAITEMRVALAKYTQYMEKTVRNGRWQLACTVLSAGVTAGLSLGALVAPPLAIPAALSSLSSVAQYIAFGQPGAAGPGQSAIAAMFYAARRASLASTAR